jgi:hypothetical protein
MDFEAKAREVLEGLLGPFSDPADRDSLRLVADALRAAALDDEAREAARAEVGDLLRTFRYEGLHTNPRPTVGDGSRFDRLLWILGLSEGERRFVKALADDWAGDFDGLSVFADWLEDQGRPEDGTRVRRLVPRDGDVIVVRHPPGPRHEAHCATVQQILDALAARGVRVCAVIMSHDMTLVTAPPAAMRAAGWVRAEDVERAVAAAIRAALPDDSDLETADPEAMRAAGWVRAEDVRRALRDVADDAATMPGGVNAAVRKATALFPPPGYVP